MNSDQLKKLLHHVMTAPDEELFKGIGAVVIRKPTRKTKRRVKRGIVCGKR